MELQNRLKRWHQTWPQPLATYTYDASTEHHCLNCGHDYAGNFCPNCGQKSNMQRITWKSMLTSFLDIWDFNTRSIPSTMWQLIYRPGYLMKDYLQGRRQSYFPPIKLLFVVALITAIIGYWFPPEKQALAETAIEATSAPKGTISEQAETNDEAAQADESAENDKDMAISKDMELRSEKLDLDILDRASEWTDKNRGWTALILCCFLILPTCLFFRWAPGYKKISIPECFFVQAYLAVIELTCSFISDYTSLFEVWPVFLFYLAYLQLFGYGRWGTFWRTTLVLILGCCTFLFLVCAVGVIYILFEVVE